MARAIRHTRDEIIDETADFYQRNDRALESQGGCVYVNDLGKHCAVGRCINRSDGYLRKLNGEGDVRNVNKWLIKKKNMVFDDILFAEYRGQTLKFWEEIQFFHDHPDNWYDKDYITLQTLIRRFEFPRRIKR